MNVQTTVTVQVSKENPFGKGDEKNHHKYQIAKALGLDQFCGVGCPVGVVLIFKEPTMEEISRASQEAQNAVERIVDAVNAIYEMRMKG